MPTLKDSRPIKDVLLPDSGITVRILDGLLAGDVADLASETNQSIQSLKIVVKLIKEWDATDESGAVLPVNLDTVKLLSVNDLKAIQDSLSFVQDFLAQAAGQSSR
jgi:hypothetical protein